MADSIYLNSTNPHDLNYTQVVCESGRVVLRNYKEPGVGVAVFLTRSDSHRLADFLNQQGFGVAATPEVERRLDAVDGELIILRKELQRLLTPL